jgi:hypothetical protein
MTLHVSKHPLRLIVVSQGAPGYARTCTIQLLEGVSAGENEGWMRDAGVEVTASWSSGEFVYH